MKELNSITKAGLIMVLSFLHKVIIAVINSLYDLCDKIKEKARTILYSAG